MKKILILLVAVMNISAALACSCEEGNDIELHRSFLSKEAGVDQERLLLKAYKEKIQVLRIPEILILMSQVDDGSACALDCSGLGIRTVSKFEFYNKNYEYCQARVITPAMAAKTVFMDHGEDENFDFEDVLKIKMKCY